MEFCPHGARLVIDERGIVLLDDCAICAEIIAEHPELQPHATAA